jgi:hypothetical protein
VESIIGETLRMAGATGILFAYRSKYPVGAIESDHEDITESVQLPEHLVDLAGIFDANRCLRITVGVCPLADSIEKAVAASIPAAVRRDWCPCEFSYVAGWHSITDYSGDEERRLARAFLSFDFWGYGCPRDMEATRSMLAEVPGVVEVWRQLDTIAGPLKLCAVWDV